MEDTSGGMWEESELYPDHVVNTGYQDTKGTQCREQENISVGLTGSGKSRVVNTLVDNIVDTRSSCEYDKTNHVQCTQDQQVETTDSNQENEIPCVDVKSQEKTTSNSGLKMLMMAPLLALASTQLMSTQLPNCPLSEETQVHDYDKILDIQDHDSCGALNPGITTEAEKEVMTTLNTRKKRIAETTWVELIKYSFNRKLDVVLSMKHITDTKDVVLCRRSDSVGDRLKNCVDTENDFPSKISTKSFQQRNSLVESVPSYYVPKQEHSFESNMMVYQREKMFEQCNLLQTEETQKQSQETFPSESDHKDSQEEDLAGVLESNSSWTQRGKEESDKRIKNHSPWQEEFEIESSMIAYDSYKIAVLL